MMFGDPSQSSVWIYLSVLSLALSPTQLAGTVVILKRVARIALPAEVSAA